MYNVFYRLIQCRLLFFVHMSVLTNGHLGFLHVINNKYCYVRHADSFCCSLSTSRFPLAWVNTKSIVVAFDGKRMNGDAPPPGALQQPHPLPLQPNWTPPTHAAAQPVSATTPAVPLAGEQQQTKQMVIPPMQVVRLIGIYVTVSWCGMSPSKCPPGHYSPVNIVPPDIIHRWIMSPLEMSSSRPVTTNMELYLQRADLCALHCSPTPVFRWELDS